MMICLLSVILMQNIIKLQCVLTAYLFQFTSYPFTPNILLQIIILTMNKIKADYLV